MEGNIENYLITDCFLISGVHAIKAKELVDRKIFRTYMELVIYAMEIGLQSGKISESDLNTEIKRKILPEMYFNNKIRIQQTIYLSALFEFPNSKNPFEELALVNNDKSQSKKYVEKLKGYVRFGIEKIYSQLSEVDLESSEDIVGLLSGFTT